MAGMHYRFGPFVVDRTAYRVLRGGDAVELTPKLLDLLLYLLDRPASLVTKEELLDALWPDANVTENALAQAMSELRQALGDDAAAPQFIRTIARRGYRFVAEVHNVQAAPRPAPATDDRLPSTSGGGIASTSDDRKTIAVMDFTDVTGAADSRWLSAGIAETVAGDLRALGHFRVVDRWRVSEAARRAGGSLQQVAADLGARLAVVGSYQQRGDRIRITARLVDVVTGDAIADAKVDGLVHDVFALQDQVVLQFSKEMGLVGAPPSRGARHGLRETASLEAYRAYTEGWLRLESLDVREMPKAIIDFERAVAADPRYALAITGLSSAEFALYETTRCDNEPAEDVLERAVQHARHGVELDDRLAEAHATLAMALAGQWRTEEAVSAARRAVALEPSNWRHLFRLGYAAWGEERLRAASHVLALYPEFAFAYFHMATVQVARGHLAQAETVLRQGAAVQDRQIGRGGRYPALGLHWLLGLVRLAEDDVDEALKEFDREHQLAEPHRLFGREYAMQALHGRGLALLTAGRAAEAIDAFDRALELYPDHAPSHLGLALAHQTTRTASAADKANAELAAAQAALGTLTRAWPIEAALVRARLLTARNEGTQAVAVLDRFLADAPPGLAAWTLPVEPLLRQLQSASGFTGVLARLADRAR